MVAVLASQVRVPGIFLKEDHIKIVPSQFGSIRLKRFKSEDHVLQESWLLGDNDKYNFRRRPSMDHSHKQIGSAVSHKNFPMGLNVRISLAVVAPLVSW